MIHALIKWEEHNLKSGRREERERESRIALLIITQVGDGSNA